MEEGKGHDWHMFDEVRGWEAKKLRVGGGYLVRHVPDDRGIERLTAEEFEQWRAEGPNPKELD